MDSSISEFIVKWAILGRVGGGSRPLRGMPLKDMLCPCPTKKKKKKKTPHQPRTLYLQNYPPKVKEK
jgi:hypothetical protein